jgi:hypothetical protein
MYLAKGIKRILLTNRWILFPLTIYHGNNIRRICRNIHFKRDSIHLCKNVFKGNSNFISLKL